MNKYEKACREWLKGCSCAKNGHQEECQDCTQTFLGEIRELKTEEKLIQYFKCPSCGEALQEQLGGEGSILECQCGYRAEIPWEPNTVFHAPEKVFYARLKNI